MLCPCLMGSVVWGCKTSTSLCSLSLQGLACTVCKASLGSTAVPLRLWPISLQLKSHWLEKPQKICFGVHCQPLCKEQAFFFEVGTCGLYSWAVNVSQSVFLANNKPLCHTCFHLEALWILWVMLICPKTTSHQDLKMTNAKFTLSCQRVLKSLLWKGAEIIYSKGSFT